MYWAWGYFLAHVFTNSLSHFAGYIPNCALAVEAMLATASIGAIWSSTSPDFGVTVLMNNPHVSLSHIFQVMMKNFWAKFYHILLEF